MSHKIIGLGQVAIYDTRTGLLKVYDETGTLLNPPNGTPPGEWDWR